MLRISSSGAETLNEEQLIDDLYNQQSLAKDAVRSLESLSKQFENEKNRIRKEAQSKMDEAIKKERKLYSKQLHRNEEQEKQLIEAKHQINQYEIQIKQMEEDMDSIRAQNKLLQESYIQYCKSKGSNKSLNSSASVKYSKSSFHESHHSSKKSEERYKSVIKEHEEKLRLVTEQLEELKQQKHDNMQFQEIAQKKESQVQNLVCKIKTMEKFVYGLESEVEKLQKQLLEERLIREDKERELELIHKTNADNVSYFSHNQHHDDITLEPQKAEYDAHNEGWMQTYKGLSNDLNVLRNEIIGLKENSLSRDEKENVHVNTLEYTKNNFGSKRIRDNCKNRFKHVESNEIFIPSYQNKLKNGNRTTTSYKWADQFDQSNDLVLTSSNIIDRL